MLFTRTQGLGYSGRRFGVKRDTQGLAAYNGKRVRAVLNKFSALENASDLVTSLRLIKSPAEIAFVRRIGTLGDAALDEAKRLAVAGVDEDDMLVGIQGPVFLRWHRPRE
jgi:Xaa-Pro dipeptidase